MPTGYGILRSVIWTTCASSVYVQCPPKRVGLQLYQNVKSMDVDLLPLFLIFSKCFPKGKNHQTLFIVGKNSRTTSQKKQWYKNQRSAIKVIVTSLILTLNVFYTLLFNLIIIFVTLNIFLFSRFVLHSFYKNVPKEKAVINEIISVIRVK